MATTTKSLITINRDNINDFVFKFADYQRPYVWTVEQIHSLYNSITRKVFIGTIVAYEIVDESPKGNKGVTLEIVDGQQRLLTLAFLLGHNQAMHFNVQFGEVYDKAIEEILSRTNIDSEKYQDDGLEYIRKLSEIKNSILEDDLNTNIPFEINIIKIDTDNILETFTKMNTEGTAVETQDLYKATLMETFKNKSEYSEEYKKYYDTQLTILNDTWFKILNKYHKLRVKKKNSTELSNLFAQAHSIYSGLHKFTDAKPRYWKNNEIDESFPSNFDEYVDWVQEVSRDKGSSEVSLDYISFTNFNEKVSYQNAIICKMLNNKITDKKYANQLKKTKVFMHVLNNLSELSSINKAKFNSSIKGMMKVIWTYEESKVLPEVRRMLLDLYNNNIDALQFDGLQKHYLNYAKNSSQRNNRVYIQSHIANQLVFLNSKMLNKQKIEVADFNRENSNTIEHVLNESNGITELNSLIIATKTQQQDFKSKTITQKIKVYKNIENFYLIDYWLFTELAEANIENLGHQYGKMSLYGKK